MLYIIYFMPSFHPKPQLLIPSRLIVLSWWNSQIPVNTLVMPYLLQISIMFIISDCVSRLGNPLHAALVGPFDVFSKVEEYAGAPRPYSASDSVMPAPLVNTGGFSAKVFSPVCPHVHIPASNVNVNGVVRLLVCKASPWNKKTRPSHLKSLVSKIMQHPVNRKSMDLV